MSLFAVRTRSVMIGLALCFLFQTGGAMADIAVERDLADTIHDLEVELDARIGVLIRDSATDWEWGVRQDERFLMASTFKSVLCGAVLNRVDEGTLALDEQIEINGRDIIEYAPVAEEHVGGALTIGELCYATLDLSDNTAANLLLERLGGPGAVTAFLRSIGDPVTRLDRIEPELNLFSPGDPRDTTSPAAILTTWEAMLTGDALSPNSRGQLTDWMSDGGVTGGLLRASTPEGWLVVDKSGGGRDYTRNLVAMVTPPGGSPYFVAIFLSDTPADWSTRNAAVAEIASDVVDLLRTRHVYDQ